MQSLNVSSFLSCMHNIDVPEVFFNFVSRTSIKKIGIYVGLPGLFDDDFEYIVRRSKFMVHRFLN